MGDTGLRVSYLDLGLSFSVLVSQSRKRLSKMLRAIFTTYIAKDAFFAEEVLSGRISVTNLHSGVELPKSFRFRPRLLNFQPKHYIQQFLTLRVKTM